MLGGTENKDTVGICLTVTLCIQSSIFVLMNGFQMSFTEAFKEEIE